jgi:hypothetical protein
MVLDHTSEIRDPYENHRSSPPKVYRHTALDIGNGQSLLQRAPPRELTSGVQEQYCPTNSKVRAGMWSKGPKISSPFEDSILRLLGTICLESGLSDCKNQGCTTTRNNMSLIAPACEWKEFRDWALVAMSCQHNFSNHVKLSLANAHVANAVFGCVRILDDFRFRPQRFRPDFDGPRRVSDVVGVCNIIHWLATIQFSLGISMGIEKWDHQFLPLSVTRDCNSEAEEKANALNICKRRLWNLVSLADRTQSDLPVIVEALSRNTSLSHDYSANHRDCTRGQCRLAKMDSTKCKQLHKCGDSRDCRMIEFNPDRLLSAVERGDGTAWLWDLTDLAQAGARYIAVSHVWSDGTGVGVQKHGRVNSCLLAYFHHVAKQLDPSCVALWWDTIAIPIDDVARSKALSKMHNNYTHAAYTVVHDSYLLGIDGTNHETACLAIVLSPWFTRGWTALELVMSKKVVFLFRSPRPKDSGPAQIHLDSILAKNPASSSQIHWMVSCMIRRLCKSAEPTHHIRDILIILKPRATSWIRDRAVIAGLLAKADLDFREDGEHLTRAIISHFGRLPYSCLLHGRPTMASFGPYSWCPNSLDEMPIDKGTDMNGDLSHPEGIRMLEVVDGVVSGLWDYRPVSQDEFEKGHLRPCGLVAGFENALMDPESCLLLKGGGQIDEEEPLLLVIVFGLDVNRGGELPILDCEYVGTVLSDEQRHTGLSWKPYEIRIGRKRDKQRNFTTTSIMAEADRIMREEIGD